MRSEFDAFVLEQTDGLVKVAFLLTGSQQDAEDLVQETWLAVHRRWLLVRRSQNRRAYVRRILTNLFLSEQRRRRPVEVELAEGDRLVSRTADVDEQVAERDAMARALSRLSPRERTAIVLKYYVRLDTSEISEAMGIGESSVRSAASRGAANLRSLMTVL